MKTRKIRLIPAQGRRGTETSEKANERLPGTEEGKPGALEVKTVRNYKRHARALIAGRFARIMTTLAEKSEEGSLPHMKYLFEIGGVQEEIREQARSKAEPSLAKLLLAEVRRRNAKLRLGAGGAAGQSGGAIVDGSVGSATKEAEFAERESDESAESA